MYRSDMFFILCVKQKTAYEMRISDWSSDVCSSDLHDSRLLFLPLGRSLALHDEETNMANHENRFKGLHYRYCVILGIQQSGGRLPRTSAGKHQSRLDRKSVV